MRSLAYDFVRLQRTAYACPMCAFDAHCPLERTEHIMAAHGTSPPQPPPLARRLFS